jgi:hypothetical protein
MIHKLSFHLNVTLPIVILLGLWLWVLLAPIRVKKVQRISYFNGARGLTLPGFIILVEDTPGRMDEALRHELAHFSQLRKYSPLGVAMVLGWHYGFGYVKGLIRNGHWPKFKELWDANPLEIEANKAKDSSAPLPSLRGWA